MTVKELKNLLDVAEDNTEVFVEHPRVRGSEWEISHVEYDPNVNDAIIVLFNNERRK